MSNTRKNTIVLGEYSCMSNSRKKFANPPCDVGDIVLLIKQYRNGKPVPKDKMELQFNQVGYVFACEHHSAYGEECITVRWNGDTLNDSMYLKNTSGCFLYKIS